MIRKLILALGATAVIGAAALTPTAASAWGHGHHGHRWIGFGGPTLIVSAPTCYYVKQKVLTPFGWQIQRVEVCE